MLISFVIPFYGLVSQLKRCLDSIAAQTDGDFEAIVVDDVSPEDGEAVAISYGDRFRYIRQKTNGSCYQARRRGVLEARGAYVVPVDPDDYVMPELVARLKTIIRESDPDLVVYNVKQDEDGVIHPHWCRYDPGMLSSEETLDKMRRKELQWNIWSKAVRRSIWLKAIDISPASQTVYVNASEDFCIVVPLVLSSRRIVVIDYDGYRYCQNPASICHGVSFRQTNRAIRDTLKARSLVLDFAARTNQPMRMRAAVRDIAGMIVRWWYGEWIASLKKAVKGWFGWTGDGTPVRDQCEVGKIDL